jgi:hypothetical protein
MLSRDENNMNGKKHAGVPGVHLGLHNASGQRAEHFTIREGRVQARTHIDGQQFAAVAAPLKGMAALATPKKASSGSPSRAQMSFELRVL